MEIGLRAHGFMFSSYDLTQHRQSKTLKKLTFSLLPFNIFSSSASPESGLGTSHTSLPGSGQGSANDQVMNEDMYYEAEPLQALGTCKALYPFDGK